MVGGGPGWELRDFWEHPGATVCLEGRKSWVTENPGRRLLQRGQVRNEEGGWQRQWKGVCVGWRRVRIRVARRQTTGLVTVPEKGRGKHDSEVPGLGIHRSPGKEPGVGFKDSGVGWVMDHGPRFLGLDPPAGSLPLWFPSGAPAQVSFWGPCQGAQVKLAYMQMHANETNPAWAPSQEQGEEEGCPSPDSPSDMPPGMPPPQLGFLQLGELAPGITLKLKSGRSQAGGSRGLGDFLNQSEAVL